MQNIKIQGACVHNLKGFDVSIPKGKVTVVTGVSGSGKSSLVFDIIFEEGRRQYLQSLGILASVEEEHKFASIFGISPTVAVQQNIIRQSNPRSTVGTRSGLLNLLGALYAVEGRISCTFCGTPVGEDLLCTSCGNQAERLPPRYFSSNDPNGMCLKCSGRGSYYEINMAFLLPTVETTLRDMITAMNMTPGYINLLSRKYAAYFDVPFQSIPWETQAAILYGNSSIANPFQRPFCLEKYLMGQYLRKGIDSNGMYTRKVCPACEGNRVGEEARRVTLSGKHIGQMAQMPLSDLLSVMESLLENPGLPPFSQNLIQEIQRKLRQLIKIRLGYLTLYREMPSLSGGEVQRLFLSSHLESRMDSLIYILDEPTAGLHESEKGELLEAVFALKELGNTVLVVEHDRTTIENAENILDIGPGAGVQGGEVIYQGDLAGLLREEHSLTGQYLSGRRRIQPRQSKREAAPGEKTPCLELRQAGLNNLKDVSVRIPLGMLVGIAGVSGSGKSSLISDTLVPLLKNQFQGDIPEDDNIQEDEVNADELSGSPVMGSLDGVGALNGLAEVSQSPIGRNSNSNPVTYIGIWDKVRQLYACQTQAKALGLTAGHFSFNSKGACPECKGSGTEKIWLGGNTYLEKTCRNCGGKRYNEEALSILYQGRSIRDVLDMSVSEAMEFFADQKSILPTLSVLERIGMGYIKLGQPTPTLSGGESQRIKLAKEIGRRRKGNILYVLDEPTTGLSLYDIDRLIQLMDELVTKGNSVIVIEHDPHVLSVCDWLIELGPEGGALGGRIIAEGTPLELKQNPASKTGRYLA